MTDHTANAALDAHLDRLIEADAAALDALIEAGFDPSAVEPGLRERAARCAELLALIGSPVGEPDGALVDVTLARVAVARREASGVDLTPRDEDALEALVAAGFDPGRCPGGVRARAFAHAQMLSLLDVPVDASRREPLVAATLARVGADVESAERRMVLPLERGRSRFRWSDLVSVAALLLVGAAVALPMVGAIRGQAQRAACQASLLGAMRGFAGYANDYREALPQASASVAGQRWWNVGTPEESNSANLFTLARARYASLPDVTCAANPAAPRVMDAGARDWASCEQVSYSYQNLFAPERPRWTRAQATIVLADRSPVVVRAKRGEWVNPVANSDNHAGRGQNVLRSDGSSEFLRSPVLAGGDNIWLPASLERLIAQVAELAARGQRPDHTRDLLHGVETPVGASDVFLSP